MWLPLCGPPFLFQPPSEQRSLKAAGDMISLRNGAENHFAVSCKGWRNLLGETGAVTERGQFLFGSARDTVGFRLRKDLGHLSLQR